VRLLAVVEHGDVVNDVLPGLSALRNQGHAWNRYSNTSYLEPALIGPVEQPYSFFVEDVAE
jgi:methionine synthase II (cobalamin-independent)